MKKRTRSKITDLIADEIRAAAKPAPVPPPPQLTNHIIFVLDDSGSMSSCYAEAVRQLNNNFATVREKAKALNQRTTVSLYTFGSTVREVYLQQPVETLRDLDPWQTDRGMTALRDALGQAIDAALRNPGANDPNTSYLLVCATDGGENQSRSYSEEMIKDRLRQTQATDRWTYAFMVPPGSKQLTMQLGVPEGNIVEWQNTERGARDVGMKTNHSVGSYYTARSVGVRAMKNFYTTDLSKITSADLAKMDDVSRKFKTLQIDREVGLQTFVEAHGLTFVVGAGYYLLMKKELLRAGRQVLVQEKGTRRLFGGAQARRILGLPDGEVEVTPGNHANYDIYFQSTSHNRALVRGTKLFYDLTQQPGLQHTWATGTTTTP